MNLSVIAFGLAIGITSSYQAKSQNIELQTLSCNSFRTTHNLEKSKGSLYSVQLEKEINPNIWVVTNKIRTEQSFYVFNNLENGKYRSTLVETLINGDNNQIYTKISEPIEISCLEQRSSNSNEENFEIFPNPAKNEIYLSTNVQYSKEDKASYEIINLTGKKFILGEFIGSNLNIDLSKLENGSYFIRILKNQNIIGTKKLLITKN